MSPTKIQRVTSLRQAGKKLIRKSIALFAETLGTNHPLFGVDINEIIYNQ